MTNTARAMQQYGPYMHDRRGWDHPWLMVVFMLVVAAVVALGVWALVRESHHRAAAYPAPIAPPGGMPTDPALDVLRMRFARGEIDEAEYAARAAHLQGTPPPGPASG